MVVSNKYNYLFIEVPQTGSYAIHHELLAYYAAEEILHKHATYKEFEGLVGKQEAQKYFVFAGVRNPLDSVVSNYAKLITNHDEAFSNPAAALDNLVDFSDIEKYHWVLQSNASFPDYFKRYYVRPYDNMISLSAHRLDFVIRYENLQHDVEQVLERIGLQCVRLLPNVNRTQREDRPFEDYYTDEIIPQAKEVFGAFATQWEYQLPLGWGPYQYTLAKRMRYAFYQRLRRIYLSNLRYSESTVGIVLRRWRARWIT